MQSKPSRLFLFWGLLGTLLMACSDWLMIYGDTAFSGALPWLTAGVSAIPAGRNALAMVLAFPAVIFYLLALWGLQRFLIQPKQQRAYLFLTALGMLPWLALHLFYVMILYAFAFLHTIGEAALAYTLCEALFSHLSWVVIGSEVLMVLPFLYLFVLFLKGKTVYARWAAWFNPLTFYVLLKLLTMVLPDCGLRLAFVNGLMSESMFLWFLSLLLLPQNKKDA